jgi:hypothetical protein
MKQKNPTGYFSTEETDMKNVSEFEHKGTRFSVQVMERAQRIVSVYMYGAFQSGRDLMALVSTGEFNGLAYDASRGYTMRSCEFKESDFYEKINVACSELF